MEKITNEIKEKNIDEIKQIEELCCLEMKEVIFDSEFCDWSIRSSIFDTLLEEKNQLIILLETETKKKFGCFINSEIDVSDYSSIEDEEAFIFVFNIKNIIFN